MFNNFHEIKAVISNSQWLSVSFYGMAERIQGMMDNRIKFKNLVVKAKLYFQTKAQNTNIKITNSKLGIIMLSVLKPKENIIKIKNEVSTKLISLIKAKEENKITFFNKPIQKLAILFVSNPKENEFKFENSKPETNALFCVKLENNEFLIDNNNKEGLHSTISLRNNIGQENKFSFQNSSVNASASYFMKLEAMSGSLNAYYNQTLNDTGRKKIL